MLRPEKQHPRLNLLLLLLILLSACGGKVDPPPANSLENSPEEVVAQDQEVVIKNRYQEVNGWFNRAELSMDSTEYDCENDPSGGKISFYRMEGELVMIRHDYYRGDHFGASEKFYLIDEQPVFIHLTEESWNFAGPPDGDPTTPHTQDDITEFRFYLDNQRQSIKCLRKDYVLRSWIELPTDPNEIPNKTITCGEEVTECLERFSLLISGINPLDDC